MALSNIFSEPRREITETAIGLAIAVPLVGADLLFGIAGHATEPSVPIIVGMAFGLVIVVGLGVAAVLIFAALALIHKLGEAVCNKLQNRGIHLRPRQRR